MMADDCHAGAELAKECGACYHRYGAALFYRAQEESDVFGAPLQQAARATADLSAGAGPSAHAASGRVAEADAHARAAGAGALAPCLAPLYLPRSGCTILLAQASLQACTGARHHSAQHGHWTAADAHPVRAGSLAVPRMHAAHGEGLLTKKGVKAGALRADDEKENLHDAKGKAPMRAEDLAAREIIEAAGARDGEDDEDEDDEDEGGEGDDEGEGGGEGDDEGEGGDMQLAWEMLEVARAIYAKSGAAHAAELAGAQQLGSRAVTRAGAAQAASTAGAMAGDRSGRSGA